MAEWWTYRLSDFLMFSPRIYWRLVEQYNRELWPLQLLALLAGVALVAAAWRHPMPVLRWCALGLAAAWLWVAWAFHWQRYAPINWAAQLMAAAWAFEAALLLLLGAVARNADDRPSPSRRRAGVILALAGLAYPAFSLAFGRPWPQAEVAGLMPDPTALFTLGLLQVLPFRRWRRWALAALPVLALLMGAATHLAFSN